MACFKLKQVVESCKYPFSIGQLRHFLLHRHKNGLDMAVRKIGKCIYLDEDLLNKWIESKAEGRAQNILDKKTPSSVLSGDQGESPCRYHLTTTGALSTSQRAQQHRGLVHD